MHKLSLPTHINEPLTDLQRRAEAFEASELLDVVRFCCLSVTPSVYAPHVSGLHIPSWSARVQIPGKHMLCFSKCSPLLVTRYPTGELLLAHCRAITLPVLLCAAYTTQDMRVPNPLLLLPMQAALAPKESLERLFQVTAFAISMYNTIKRVQKPFKNLEQSTYELVHPEKGIRCVGEKVCSLGKLFLDLTSLMPLDTNEALL